MPLVKIEHPAPSRRPYALLTNTFRSDRSGYRIIDAYWLGRKRGRTTVSVGQVRFWWQFQDIKANSHPDLDTCLALADERYGGHAEAKWDGQRLWTAQPLMPGQHDLLVEQLDAVLRNVPDLPDGCQGWYRFLAKRAH